MLEHLLSDCRQSGVWTKIQTPFLFRRATKNAEITTVFADRNLKEGFYYIIL